MWYGNTPLVGRFYNFITVIAIFCVSLSLHAQSTCSYYFNPKNISFDSIKQKLNADISVSQKIITLIPKNMTPLELLELQGARSLEDLISQNIALFKLRPELKWNISDSSAREIHRLYIAHMESHLNSQGIEYEKVSLKNLSKRIDIFHEPLQSGEDYYLRILPTQKTWYNRHAQALEDKYHASLYYSPYSLLKMPATAFVSGSAYYASHQTLLNLTARDSIMFHELTHLKTRSKGRAAAYRIRMSPDSNIIAKEFPLTVTGYRTGYSLDELNAFKREVFYSIQNILTQIKLKQYKPQLIEDFKIDTLYLLDLSDFSSLVLETLIQKSSWKKISIQKKNDHYTEAYSKVPLGFRKTAVISVQDSSLYGFHLNHKSNAEHFWNLFIKQAHLAKRDQSIAQVAAYALHDLSTESSPTEIYFRLKILQRYLKSLNKTQLADTSSYIELLGNSPREAP